MRPIYLLFIVLLCCAVRVGAQTSIRNLYFNSGQNITRLDFITEPPTIIPTGIPDAGGVAEGIAHYEDQDGNVIFWVNSNGVYNQTGALMAGSAGILTNSSAAEIVVCPKPEEDGKYYIFYNTETCSALRSTVVDMSLNGGLGDVSPGTLNNVIDNASFGEGIEVIRIPGTCEYWLIGYQCNGPGGAGFKRFRVDGGGITTGTIIHNFASPVGFDGRGELDFHRDKIGCAFAFTNTVFCSNFDAIAGTISNPVTLNNPSFSNGPYGIEFSPDANKMYIALWYAGGVPNDIFQYDFTTAVTTGYASPGDHNLGHIELGRDGKLYIIHDGSSGITVIETPNDPVPTLSNLNTANSLGLGISDFIQSDIFNTGVFTGDTLCRTVGNSITLNTNNASLQYNWINAITNEIVFTGSQYNFTMPTSPVNLLVVRADAPDCSDTIRYLINPNPIVDAGPDLTISQGQSIPIQATATTSGASYIWFPSESLDDPFALAPTASPTTTTTYFLSATIGNCQGSDLMTITVENNNIETDTLCVPVGSSVSLSIPDTLQNITWTTLADPGTILSTDATFSVEAVPSVITYVGSGSNPNTPGGYTAQIMVIARPNLDAGSNTTIAVGESIQLNATGGGLNGYVWTPTTNLDNPNVANPNASPLATTTYYVSSSNNAFCAVSDSMTVTVIIITNGEVDSLCANVGSQQTLNVSGTFASIVWTDTAQPNTPIANGSSFSFTTPNQNLIYQATATDALGNITNFYFKIFANPQVDAGADLTVNEGSVVQLNATNGINYTWSPASVLTDAIIANPSTVPLYETTDFSVTSTTANGCTSSDSVVINVKSESLVLVPNAFSPNNDNHNDVLRLTTFNVTELLQFEIFNRWGQQVFATKSLTDGWDGKHNGVEQEVGTYVYQLRVRAKDGSEYDRKGNFTLLR